MTLAMFGPIGMQEMLIIAGVAVLIFGPKQLPKLGRSVGETIREFRKVGTELTDGQDKDDEPPPMMPQATGRPVEATDDEPPF